MHPTNCQCTVCLVDRSSFGTPEAKAARESVSDEQVARVLARVKELDALAEVLEGTGVTANTWQSAARRLADENRQLRADLATHPQRHETETTDEES